MTESTVSTVLSLPHISPAAQALIGKHEKSLNAAFEATKNRTFYEHYKENPKAYPETAQAEGLAKFEAQLGKKFDRIIQVTDYQTKAEEVSPYTTDKLGISYPALKDTSGYLSEPMKHAKIWAKVDFRERCALLVEALDRVATDFYEIAYATMHTTGQGFMMAFQASGPHANDRALEAVAIAYDEMNKIPQNVLWEKNLGKITAKLDKYFRIVPKGLACAIGCSTFPIWNSVPGIFASLATGNPVVVKPHPLAIYPLAIVIARVQEVLKEYGYAPEICILATDTPAAPLTETIAKNSSVKIIDYTGGEAYGKVIDSWQGKITFTEKAGVNSIIVDSTTDLDAMAKNIAFSAALYSGQMCTAPQNIFIPEGGISINGENIPFNTVAEAITKAIAGLTTNPKAAPAVCGAIQNEHTLNRIEETHKKIETSGAKVLLPSQIITNPEFPKARTATTLVCQLKENQNEFLGHEYFGPIVFIAPTKGLEQSIDAVNQIAGEKGAISCGAYVTDPEKMNLVADELQGNGVPVSFNLLGQVFVNQNSTFSDYHVTGVNPSGNATLSDAAFVTRRFSVVGMRVEG